MAHTHEWKEFDEKSKCLPNKCTVENLGYESTMPNDLQIKYALATILPCPSIELLYSFKDAFLQSTGLAPDEDMLALLTTSHINIEPIVLAIFGSHHFPFPKYYGACGRLAMVSFEGNNLVSYINSPFPFRVHLVRELLQTMYDLNNAHPELIIYYPDINLENFVYNETEKKVKVIDLEYIVVVEKHKVKMQEIDEKTESSIVEQAECGESCTEYSAATFCTTFMEDFNIKQVCRYLLGSITKHDQKKILHDIPLSLDHKYNISQTIDLCGSTTSTKKRLETYHQLLTIFDSILII
ncbi:unnamed protein product [Didymodactylos carnosus]|uniref:FAM69 protein-kinase domain-containing protein n=1 Tax=Didymodactylos carnosus TaxID=1234261 RepID=A0A813UID3_9BILA|nr:unnamed protein product [Didymodactylos carnosus]CAF0921697.1 unnamed protein product [Didymodactylos carnosus]CAF3616959.1 unnamed protein product [Didymodactylos carnosus]CAF3699098.1 unnamed protein product [Didymodactylos carnosus]